MAALRIRFAALTLAASIVNTPCHALVGESETNGPMSPHAVMVLARSKDRAGFCTGVVIARDAVLTAAHCVAGLKDTGVYLKQADAPVFLQPAAIAIHPQYRAQAPRTRERSIDLALIRTAAPLPLTLNPAALNADGAVSVGKDYGVSGFGVTRECEGATAGALRWGRLRTRAPLSTILLWAEDPAARGFGACEGDSGGPIFDLDAGTIVAITSWSEGAGARHCGKLTQAALLAPQRAWIDSVLRGWNVLR